MFLMFVNSMFHMQIKESSHLFTNISLQNTLFSILRCIHARRSLFNCRILKWRKQRNKQTVFYLQTLDLSPQTPKTAADLITVLTAAIYSAALLNSLTHISLWQ